MGQRRLMIKIVRPELKHLKQIVVLARETVLKATDSESAEHDLHEFFKSQLVNLTTFFQIILDDDQVVGFAIASIQKQVWSSEVLCNVAFVHCADGYEDDLDTVYDNIEEWAKENNAVKIIFVNLDISDNVEMPIEFKKIGTIYGVNL